MNHLLSLLHLPCLWAQGAPQGWHSCFAEAIAPELSFCRAREDVSDICDKLPSDRPSIVHHLRIFCTVSLLSSMSSSQVWTQDLPALHHKPLRSVLNKKMKTFNVDEIIYCFFKGELLHQKGLLLFGHFLKEIFQVTIPNFSYLREERFSHWLVTLIRKNFAHQKVIMSHIGMLRSPFGRLKIDLHNS